MPSSVGVQSPKEPDDDTSVSGTLSSFAIATGAASLLTGRARVYCDFFAVLSAVQERLPLGILSEKALNLPALPGVYLWKGPRGEVLYVGKAKSLASRVRSYLSGDLPEPRHQELMAEAVDLDTILTHTEAEALLLEATLVRQHKPRYNVELKDDKSFPYVKVSVQEPWPRLSVTRQVRND